MIGVAVSLCAPTAGSTTTTSSGAKVLKLIKTGRGGDSLACRLAMPVADPRDNGPCCMAPIAFPGVEQPTTFV